MKVCTSETSFLKRTTNKYKNRLFTYFAKLVNILDFNSKRLSIRKTGCGETFIYYIDYDKDPFYLVTDDLKEYFEENKNNKCLTMILKSQRQKMIYTRIWEEIKKLINKFDNIGDVPCTTSQKTRFCRRLCRHYDKDYGVISFDTDDILSLNSIINIYSLTIIIRSVFKVDNKFYPQIYLTNCYMTKSSSLERIKMLEYDRIDVSEGIDVNKF